MSCCIKLLSLTCTPHVHNLRKAIRAHECPDPPAKELLDRDVSVAIFDWRDLRRSCDVQLKGCQFGRDIKRKIQNAVRTALCFCSPLCLLKTCHSSKKIGRSRKFMRRITTSP